MNERMNVKEWYEYATVSIMTTAKNQAMVKAFGLLACNVNANKTNQQPTSNNYDGIPTGTVQERLMPIPMPATTRVPVRIICRW